MSLSLSSRFGVIPFLSDFCEETVGSVTAAYPIVSLSLPLLASPVIFLSFPFLCCLSILCFLFVCLSFFHFFCLFFFVSFQRSYPPLLRRLSVLDRDRRRSVFCGSDRSYHAVLLLLQQRQRRTALVRKQRERRVDGRRVRKDVIAKSTSEEAGAKRALTKQAKVKQINNPKKKRGKGESE